jgi:hypothetical protein
MPFFDKDAANAASVQRAEDDLNAAIAAERPEELAQTDEEKKPKGTVKPKTPASDEIPSGEGHNWEKRYGDLRRYIDTVLTPKQKKEVDELKGKMDELTKKLDNLANKAAPAALPQTVEEVEAMKRENPAAYRAIEHIAGKLAEAIIAEKTEGLRKSVETVEQYSRQNAEEAAYIKLQKKHPKLDLDRLDSDTKFQEWCGRKSKAFLAPLFTNKEDVDAASDVLTAYETECGIGTTKKADVNTARKEAGKEVKAPSQVEVNDEDNGYDFTESQLENMSGAEFDRRSEEINKALKTNRVLRDISDPGINAARRQAARAA